jgi:uroporphyrinogen-III synthase
MLNDSLSNRVIAVPEARELDVFAQLLERRGARVWRCPLVDIVDASDPQPVRDWLTSFMADGCDDLILLTGEGLRRLLACVDRHDPISTTHF